MADLTAEFAAAFFTSTDDFDHERADRAIAELERHCEDFAQDVGASRHSIDLVAEGRLSRQVWQIDVPLRTRRFTVEADGVAQLLEDFRRLHEQIFAVRDEDSAVEIVALRARVTCPISNRSDGRLARGEASAPATGTRRLYFSGRGFVDAAVYALDGLELGSPVLGPAIVESRFCTIVVDPGTVAERRASGSLVVRLLDDGSPATEERSSGVSIASE
jgi:N-methylhydantoinase A